MDAVPHLLTHYLLGDIVFYFSKLLTSVNIPFQICILSPCRIAATMSMYILRFDTSCQITLWKSYTIHILQCPQKNTK